MWLIKKGGFMKIFIAVLMLISPISANAWSLFGNYDDCILDKVKAGMSNAAVGAVKRACRNKYPLPKSKVKDPFTELDNAFTCRNIQLTKSELAKIKVQWLLYNPTTLWNGTKYAINNIVMVFYTKKGTVTIKSMPSSGGYVAPSMNTINLYNTPFSATKYKVLSAERSVCEFK